MEVHFTLKSSNKKLGGLPCSTTHRSSCPKSCPFYDVGCYALYHNLRHFWLNRVNTGEGIHEWDWDSFCKAVKDLPKDQLWRHNQAGDLPGEDGRIDAVKFKKLVQANTGRRGFTYTHKPLTDRNAGLISYANNRGFTINLSASSLTEADDLLETKAGPVVTTLPNNWKHKVAYTPAGNKVVTCPNDYNPSITCKACALCYRGRDRGYIIGFPAHGSGKRHINEAFNENRTGKDV